MTETPPTLMPCPHCGSRCQSPDGRRDGPCVNCGTPVTTPAEDIPEHLVGVLEVHACRDDPVGSGAAWGAITYGAASGVFTLLPAVWLNWQLQGTWKLLVAPTIEVTAWTVGGVIFGATSLKVLSAILAPSQAVFAGAIRGMVVGFAIGAMLGAAAIFFRHVAWGDQSLDYVWLAYCGQVTGSSVLVGSLLAVFASWATAIWVGSRLTKLQRNRPPVRQSSDLLDPSERLDATNDSAVHLSPIRFQFGISRMLFLTAAIAVIIAIPVQILARLREISKLANYMLAFEVMTVLFGILILPFLAWATFRAPTVYARLANALNRWRDLRHKTLALKERA